MCLESVAGPAACFPLLPEHGSRLYALPQVKASQRALAARQYAAEALEELDVSVDGAELTEGGDGTLGVRVYLTWRGEPLQAEVEI